MEHREPKPSELAAGGSPVAGGSPAASGEPGAPAPPPPRGPLLAREWKMLALSLWLAGLAFLIGFGIFNFLLMPKWVHRGVETSVPDLRNLAVGQAEGVLDQSGLRLSIRGEQYDAEVPKGAVISQSPRPHETVRRGRVVTVLVSLGEEYASVPALYGESMRNAGVLLARAGLQVGDVVRTHSEVMGLGFVLASDPPPQTVVARGTPVHLVESLGAVAEAYLMPDLRGLDARAMSQSLEAAGFRVKVTGAVGGFATVVDQKPEPGTRIESGDEVQLRVAGRVIP